MYSSSSKDEIGIEKRLEDELPLCCEYTFPDTE